MIVSFRKRGPESEEEKDCKSVEAAHLNISSILRRTRGSVAMGALKLNLT